MIYCSFIFLYDFTVLRILIIQRTFLVIHWILDHLSISHISINLSSDPENPQNFLEGLWESSLLIGVEKCRYAPLLGYFPKASKTWLTVKPGYLKSGGSHQPSVVLITLKKEYVGCSGFVKKILRIVKIPRTV